MDKILEPGGKFAKQYAKKLGIDFKKIVDGEVIDKVASEKAKKLNMHPLD